MVGWDDDNALMCILNFRFKAGPIERVSIPKEKDGSQRSYGFVTYKHLQSVPFALGIFAGTKLFDRDLRMNNRSANNANGASNGNANGNGNPRNSRNEVQAMIQREQGNFQAYQLEKLRLQMVSIQNTAPAMPPIGLSPILPRMNERHDSDRRERERERSDRSRKDRRSDDRERERNRPKDVSALTNSAALPTMSAQNMLPVANPFTKKSDELLGKALDINALLSFGANMQLQSPIGNGTPHHLQPKVMHRHENRPHHQNNNYSRWSQSDRGGGAHERRNNDRRDKDRGARNRQGRR